MKYFSGYSFLILRAHRLKGCTAKKIKLLRFRNKFIIFWSSLTDKIRFWKYYNKLYISTRITFSERDFEPKWTFIFLEWEAFDQPVSMKGLVWYFLRLCILQFSAHFRKKWRVRSYWESWIFRKTLKSQIALPFSEAKILTFQRKTLYKPTLSAPKIKKS